METPRPLSPEAKDLGLSQITRLKPAATGLSRADVVLSPVQGDYEVPPEVFSLGRRQGGCHEVETMRQ